MKKLIILLMLFIQVSVYSQKNISISFKNDYEDTYHLSLIIYTPDGKSQTRVSDLTPNQIKTYSFPIGTEIYVADSKQEAFAMKGNDIKTLGIKPYLVLKSTDDKTTIHLTSIGLKSSSKDHGDGL